MESVVIKDFHTGIGESEFVGNGEITNCDLDWRKGVVRINNLPTSSTFSFDQLPLWIVANEAISDQVWALGDSGTLYRGTASTNAWSTAHVPTQVGTQAGVGQGLAVWKNYLFRARLTKLDVYGPLNGSAVMNDTWQDIDSDSLWHPIIVGQDDILYGGAGRFVFSVQEASGSTFTPGTASTYTFQSRALDLPQDNRVRAIGELGKNLMSGTWKGANIYEQKVASLFPWDRISDSFNLPISLKENGIQAGININNLFYFFAGTEGKLYVTDGTNVQELAKIPQHINDLTGGVNIEVYPGSMMFHDGKIFFGVSGGNASFAHVWSYDLKSGALVQENTISSGTAVGSRVGGLLSTNRDTYLIGWRDSNSNEGIDLVGNTTRYTNYSAVVTSSFFQIGTSSDIEITSEIEVQLARPLATGQGIQLSYRTDLSAGFTLVPGGTIDFATYGAIQHRHIAFKVELKGGIQIRARLTTGSSSSTSPELTQIILR